MRFIRLFQVTILAGLLATIVLACAAADEPTPTATSVPPTATAVPPAATAVPPVATSVPVPVVATPVPTVEEVKEPLAFPRMPDDPMTPQYGGVLLLGETSVGQSHFDVLQFDGEGPTMRQMQNVYNLIVRMDRYDAGVVHPELAESWEWSADGLALTMYMRKGVKWHDGAPFTSADYAYTVERMTNPKEGITSKRKGDWRNLVSVETPDDYTVVLNLTQPQPDLLGNMGGYTHQVFPKHLAEALDDQGEGMKFTIVGTGPFMLKDFEPDVWWEYKANPDYFDPSLPYLDEIRHDYIKEESLRVAAYMTGKLHAPAGVREKANKILLLADPDTTWVETVGNNVAAFIPATDRAPFDDIRVRQAAALTIDHRAWVQAAEPIDSHKMLGAGFMPSSPWALPDDRRAAIAGYDWDGDIEAARAQAWDLVKQAGYPDGVKFTMIHPTLSYFQVIAILTQEQLNRGPFEVELKPYEYAAFYEEINGARQTAHVHSMGMKNLTVDGSLGECCTAEGRRNFGRWGKEEFGTVGAVDLQLDELFQRQSRELNAVERLKLVHDYEELWLQQYYHIQLGWASGIGFWSNKLHNQWPHILGYMSSYKGEVWIEK